VIETLGEHPTETEKTRGVNPPNSTQRKSYEILEADTPQEPKTNFIGHFADLFGTVSGRVDVHPEGPVSPW